MPPVAAVVSGIGSLIGGAASVAGAVASAVGSVASGVLGAGAGLAGGAAAAVGGTISALTGGATAQAAVPVMVGGEMGSLAAASALGVPAATGGVAGGLSTILTSVQAGVGIYGQLAELEIAEGMSETEKIAAQTKLMEAEAAKIYAAAPAVPAVPVTPPAPLKALPTLSAQPVYVTPAPAAAAPNYLLYAGLALLAFILLRRK